MTDLTMKWTDRDGTWFGYDPDLPGGAHVYKDADGCHRVRILVNGMVIDDAPMPGWTDDADVPAVLAYASDMTTDALVLRKARA